MQVDAVRKTYVRFYRSGSNPEHGTIYKVDKGGCSFGAPLRGDDPRDVGVFDNPPEDVVVGSRVVAELEVPEGAFGFQYFDRYEVEVVDGEETVALRSKRLNWSRMHFWDGTVLTRETIEALKPAMDILAINLLDNMDYFGWTHVVRTPQGHYKPFGPNDILVDPEQLPPKAQAA